ncbi:MAG: right-handed parallel beta-helix repeat-containing protein [Verrucomicrobiota bacterium]
MFVCAVSCLSAAPGLRQLVDEAIARGESRVTIPPGEHRLDGPIRLSGLTDFTLDGPGATLVFTNLRDGGLLITDCAGLTLRGFTIDFDPLPFTQGTVEAIDPVAREVVFALHDGYPDLAPHFLTGRAHVFSPETRSWKTSAADIYATKAEALTPRRGVLRFSPGKSEEFGSFAVGDHVVLDHRHSRGVRLERCRDVRVEGVTFWSAPSIAVLARFMGGKNVFSYKIQPGPVPKGGTQPRLLSVSADGLNYAYARTGPVIEGCDFSFMGDDGVNLHGIAFFVAKSEGNTAWILRPYNEEAFASIIEPGDEVHALAAESFGITGRAKVASFAVEANPPEDFSELAARTWRSVAVKGGRLTVYRLELTEPLALAAGDFVEIPAIAAPGYVIRDNRFTHHRARSLRLMSPDGLVENNMMEDIKHSAITLGAEFTFHREAGWVTDVTIRGNTIRRVGFDPALQRASAYTPGAISVFHRGETPSAPLPESRHERLRIEDNLIEETGCPAIHINQAHDVRITGNRIRRTNLVSKPGAASFYQLTTDQPIGVDFSTEVVVAPDQITP